MNTMPTLDETHDPARRSWVRGADGHNDFPVQNLPLGIFSPQNDDLRGGVAIGDFIVDLPALNSKGLLAGEASDAAAAAGGPALNDLLALGEGPAAESIGAVVRRQLPKPGGACAQLHREPRHI